MSFLPIVERELRVASRRSLTYWSRFFLGLGVFLFWFLLVGFLPTGLGMSRGHLIFGAIAGSIFIFALLSGVFVTADTLSQEKREGTLGLLFLTDLDASDIVLGKLTATSLPAFYGSLACLPLLAYSWLVGGVTPAEFWRVAISILASLLLSLAIGILISAVTRETRSAMGLTLLSVAGLTFLFPILGWAAVHYSGLRSLGILSSPSPGWLYRSSFDGQFQLPGGQLRFWVSLFTVLLITATALVGAGWQVRASWQEKNESKKGAVARSWLWKLRYSSLRKSLAAKLLDDNPIRWLASRDRLPALLGWTLCGILFAACGLLLLGLFSKNVNFARGSFFMAAGCAYALHHVLKWLIAIEASRRFNDDRNSGSLELLLVTPLSIDGIIAGHRRALRDTFRWPLFCSYGLNVLLFVLILRLAPTTLGSPGNVIACELCVGGVLMLAVDFQALSWVGMWMGITKPRHHRAILATLARVMLVPWAAIFILVLLTVGGGSLDFGSFMAFSLLWFGLAAVIESTFIARAKVGLHEAFRQISSDANPALTSAAWNAQALKLKLGEAA